MPAGTHDALPDARNEDVLVWINGILTPRREARISVFDSGYLIGDGIWEGIRLHHGVLAFLELHLDRLFNGLSAVRMDPGLSRPELVSALYQTVRANRMSDGVHLRLMITRGNKITPSQDPRLTIPGANIVITAEHKRSNPSVRARGVALQIVSIRRPPPSTLDQRLNCHSKLHEVMALNEALAAGADEGLMLDINGNVATCNATNFFAVFGNDLWTSTGQHCLPGITRANVLALARHAEIAVHEADFTPQRLSEATEAFVTGTFGGLTPVARIGSRALSGMRTVTERLEVEYEREIERYVSAADHSV